MDLSALSKLETLDLSFNPFGGLDHILDGLQSLPLLVSLSVSLPAPAEDHLISQLPTLTCLNGIAIVDPTRADVSGAYWRLAYSEDINKLFNDVSRQDASTTHEFHDYMNRVVQHVTRLTASEDDAFAQEGEVLKARRLLYESCFGDVIRSTFKDGHGVLGRRLQALLRYESAMMDQYDMHWRRMLQDRDDRVSHIRQDVHDAMEDIRSIIEHLPPIEAQRPSIAEENWQRGGEEAPCGAGPGASASFGSTPLAGAGHSTHMDVSRLGASASVSPKPMPPAGFMLRSQRPSSERRTPRSMFTKTLALKQLKDIMRGIYTSKVKYDDKCKQNHLPRETMEQHMYTYLNQKYGLREIILKWATAIVDAVRRYAPEDNDVAVFGKILRNEVEEGFRFVQEHLRETVRELLRSHIKAKQPLGRMVELNNTLQQTMSGTVSEDVWKEVVKYMYNTTDAALVTSIIHQHLYRQACPKLQPHRKGETKLLPTVVCPPLLYKNFVRLLLDFQLDRHERFLERFVKIFRRYDSDQNGIVNCFEFVSIVRELDSSKSEEEVESMVCQIDPHGNQLITFSDCISLLNDELLQLFHSQQVSGL
ncbi:hypothetical protein JKF63_04743 [Porcisia hertigi]|uniref:EF-hand domain-containing protein n=1 Tax=Porcisia hertigi TaxID=2761500 RepID=A0A836LC81_9TRYP|nr:hypothetical protein JKF63_04743 [Porcisia hertigi]